MADRLDLAHVFGHTRMRAWARVNCRPWEKARVYVGQLADGRWFADSTHEPGGAFLFSVEQDADEKAAELMSTGEWEPVSPNPSQDPW